MKMQLLSIADLRTIYEGVDSIDPQVRSRLLKYIENREETERHLQEEERRRREAIPEEAQDWQDVQTGTIVVRSEHWKENRCKPNDKQIGILDLMTPAMAVQKELMAIPDFGASDDSAVFAKEKKALANLKKPG
jgi:hypothetical protein